MQNRIGKFIVFMSKVGLLLFFFFPLENLLFSFRFLYWIYADSQAGRRTLQNIKWMKQNVISSLTLKNATKWVDSSDFSKTKQRTQGSGRKKPLLKLHVCNIKSLRVVWEITFQLLQSVRWSNYSVLEGKGSIYWEGTNGLKICCAHLAALQNSIIPCSRALNWWERNKPDLMTNCWNNAFLK